MLNYIIHDNINFYEEIYKDDENENKDNLCLLSGLPLERNFIKLSCSHSFNYETLFNEVYNQKQYNEYNTHIISINTIKCPYCRTVTNNLLPYIPTIKMEKIYGVNSPEKYTMNHKFCSYTFVRGKNKNFKCNKGGFETENGDLCEKHWKMYINKKNKKI